MQNKFASEPPKDAPENPEAIEDNAELTGDKDAPSGEPIAIELPIEPTDASGQPV